MSGLSTGSTIGQVIRQARADAQLTMDQLAEATGVSQGYLSRLERGLVQRPRLEVQQALADALNLPVSLFEEALTGGKEPGSVQVAPEPPLSVDASIPADDLHGASTEGDPPRTGVRSGAEPDTQDADEEPAITGSGEEKIKSYIRRAIYRQRIGNLYEALDDIRAGIGTLSEIKGADEEVHLIERTIELNYRRAALSLDIRRMGLAAISIENALSLRKGRWGAHEKRKADVEREINASRSMIPTSQLYRLSSAFKFLQGDWKTAQDELTQAKEDVAQIQETFRKAGNEIACRGFDPVVVGLGHQQAWFFERQGDFDQAARAVASVAGNNMFELPSSMAKAYELTNIALIEMKKLTNTFIWPLRKDEPIPLPSPRDESERILLGALEKAKDGLRIFNRFQEWARVHRADADVDGSTYVIREGSNQRSAAFANVTIAVLQSALGRADLAVEAGKSALDYARESKIELIEIRALRHLAECYLRAGDNANAIDHARQAIEYCASISNEFEDDHQIAVTYAVAGGVLLRAEPATSALAEEGKHALAKARAVMDGFIARVPGGITPDQAKGLRAQVSLPQT